jgi:ATP adenylyltransferase
MTPLFAPWRMTVIEGYASQTSCVFCDLNAAEPSSESLVVVKSRWAYVVMNKFPYSNGHLLLIPKRHVSDWEKLEKEELLDLMDLSQKAMNVLKRVVHAEAFNMGANLGRTAGAGIPDHVHLHIVPRWHGDTNFMPILAETKMISEHLVATHQKILQAWEKG